MNIIFAEIDFVQNAPIGGTVAIISGKPIAIERAPLDNGNSNWCKRCNSTVSFWVCHLKTSSPKKTKQRGTDLSLIPSPLKS